IDRLRAEHSALTNRAKALRELTLAPRLSPRLMPDPVDARVDDALATSALLTEIEAALDARALALEDALRELEHERNAAALAAAQTQSQERSGAGHPRRPIVVRLGGAGPIASLEVTYVVPAARWWPVYTLRIADGGAGGKKAVWWLEALVAQRSGEA